MLPVATAVEETKKPERLSVTPGARGSIKSRRDLCYGTGAVVYIEKNFPEVNLLLTQVRDEIIGLLNPEHTHKREDIIKVKSLHAAFAGYAPFVDEVEHEQYYESPEGLNNGDFLISVHQKLEHYLRTQTPYLIPVGLEFNDKDTASKDGNIMSRFNVETNDKATIAESDYAPVGALKNLLGLEKGVSWDATNRKRFTSVTTVLCTVDVEDPELIAQIKAILARYNQAIINLGKQSITNFTLASYNKRTWTRDKPAEKQQHVEIFSEIYKDRPSKIVSFGHVKKHSEHMFWNSGAKDDSALLNRRTEENRQNFSTAFNQF